MTGGDMLVRPDLAGDPGGAQLVCGICVGMKEMNDEGFTSFVEEPANGFTHAVLVKRHAHRTRGVETLGYLDPEIAWNDRHEHARHSVGLGPGTATELDHVAKAAGGDHPGSGEPPFQNRVGGRRRPMNDEVDLRDGETRLLQGGDDAEGLVVEGRRRFRDADLATVAAVDQQQIREGAADIDACDDTSRRCGVFLTHDANPERKPCLRA